MTDTTVNAHEASTAETEVVLNTVPLEPTLTISNRVCLTYQANTSSPQVNFVGKDEEEARAKLEKWLKPFLADESEENQEKVAKVLAAPPIKHDGRGRANTGKVWMINHTVKVRARVPAEDVEASKAAGWVFGGPRTPFV